MRCHGSIQSLYSIHIKHQEIYYGKVQRYLQDVRSAGAFVNYGPYMHTWNTKNMFNE